MSEALSHELGAAPVALHRGCSLSDAWSVIAVAITITETRPGYLHTTLESWARVRGIGDVHLLFCCEPGPYHRETVEVVDEVFGFQIGRRPVAAGTTLIYNPERLGPAGNTLKALRRALGETEYAIVTEEDVVVSDDILDYHAWAQRYRGDQQVAGVCSFTQSSTGGPDECFRAPFFNPLGWGTWRDRLGLLTADWGGVVGNEQAWDRGILERVCKPERQFIFPKCSRSQHIGRYGLHGGGDPDRFAGTVSTSFRSSYMRQAYREVELVNPIVRL